MANNNLPSFVSFLNPIIKGLLRLGAPMGPMVLLTVRGRRTGKPHTTPVGLFQHDGRRYLFATFGEVEWVRNLRVTGEAIVSQGQRKELVTAAELPPREATNVLRDILAPYLASRVRRSFLGMGYHLAPNATIDDFANEAKRHPGFELLEKQVEVNSIADVQRPDWVDSKLFPFESRWLGIDGHQIHYVDEGPRGAPVLLFVHPGAGWSFTYRYQIQRLKSDFRCVAPDLPGYGLSIAAENYDYTLLEQSRVLRAFVEALDLSDMVVWANDGGGPTAVLALAPLASRVQGLVVGGTFGWSIKDYPMVSLPVRLFSGRISRAINRYTNFLAWSMGSRMALGTRTLTKAERRQYTLPFKDRDARNRTLKLYNSFNDPTTQQQLDQSLLAFRDKAALIQFGEGDPMTRQGWHERWAKEVPNHRLHVLPGVRHFTFEGAPEATVQNFLDWWGETRTEAGEQRYATASYGRRGAFSQ